MTTAVPAEDDGSGAVREVKDIMTAGEPRVSSWWPVSCTVGCTLSVPSYMPRLASAATVCSNRRPTMDQLSKIHLGLDVHKDSITSGAPIPGANRPASWARCSRREQAVEGRGQDGRPSGCTWSTRLAPPGSGCSASSRAGLLLRGHRAVEDAPRTRRAGQDRRARRLALAQSSRAGDCEPCGCPDARRRRPSATCARVREDAVEACTQAKQQLGGFLLRRDLHYRGQDRWTKTHFRLAGTVKSTPTRRRWP